MSLRSRLIEAGARSFHDPGVEPHGDDRHLAALVLDAILNTLEAETANWQLSVSPLAAGEVYTLIAALRDTETDAE